MSSEKHGHKHEKSHSHKHVKSHEKHARHNKDPKKELTRKIVILVIVVMLSISATQFFFSMYKVVAVQRISMNVTVMDRMGFNLDPGEVHFGGVMPGNCGKRGLWIENKINKSLIVDVRRYGEMAEWVAPDNSTFMIQPLEKVNLKFEACIPMNTTQGNYTGTIAVVMKRP